MNFLRLVQLPRTIGRPSISARLTRRSLATVMTGKLPTVIRPSASEIRNGKLDERNLEIAVRSMHQDGLVVVEDVVPLDHIEHLNVKMTEDALTLQARGEDGPFNYNLGNLQQDAPPWAEYFSPSIFTNKIGTQITSSVLGPRPKWTFCSANAAMPPLLGQEPQRQPVHSDADFTHPSHPFALVINIPLVDMTPKNGSTEIWLGTHNTHGSDLQDGAHGERASGRIKQEVMDRWKSSGRGAECQPEVKRGSIVIRDLRLWHAGMPNKTGTQKGEEGQVRIMLAMIHFANWYRNPMKLELAEDVKPVLEELSAKGELGLEVPVDWVSKEEAQRKYLDRGFGNSYDFNQAV